MKQPPCQVLVISQTSSVRDQMVGLLEGRDHVVEHADAPRQALTLIEREPPDLVLVDLDWSDHDALAVIERTRQLAPNAAVVALADEASVHTVAESIMRGANHCLEKRMAPDALAVVVTRALEKPALARRADEAEQRAAQRLDLGNFGAVVGDHPVMQELLLRAYQASRSRANVLICGETGTGKELIAAAIHQSSKRSAAPFVRLNCASLSESLLESELFGHEKGAFTGATTRRTGRFEQAHLGTLFLDEVSEVVPAIQVKLLRFLQEREFERVGGDETIHVDVRVIAATNRELHVMLEDGSFREDLYYRLNVVRIDVPPLRARPTDIVLLAEHFLRRFAAENDKSIRWMTQEARNALLAYPWPGNVRELQNAIERAVVFCEGSELTAADIPLAGERPEEQMKLLFPGITMAEVERYAILKTLEAVGGSRSKAAKVLGLSRRTIQNRLKEWGLGGQPPSHGTDDSQSEPPAPKSHPPSS